MTDPFDFKPGATKFAVVGNPISHSKSPVIHAAFGTQCGIKLEYEAITIDIGGFKPAIRHFFARGGRGLNVSVPFKVEAFELADTLSERAKLARAVNTLRLETDGTLLGENTDGVGMVKDIENNLGFKLKHKRVLLLGAGGAARGVLGPILEAGVKEVVIANRTADKAAALASQFQAKENISGGGYARLTGEQFDAVINGTAASLSRAVPPLPGDVFNSNALAYDMMYSQEPTSFLVWAKQHNAAQTADGFGMLIEQAAASFKLWHGVMPKTGELIETLR